MYASLARFGYGIAKSLRPSKLKRGMRIAGDKVVKKRLDPAKSPKLSAAEDSGLNFMTSAGSKIQKGYTKAYQATLGSSTKRKVTTGVIGGGIGFDIFDDD